MPPIKSQRARAAVELDRDICAFRQRVEVRHLMRTPGLNHRRRARKTRLDESVIDPDRIPRHAVNWKCFALADYHPLKDTPARRSHATLLSGLSFNFLNQLFALTLR